MIQYTSDVTGITADQLKGFFVDWPNPPSQERHVDILQKSAYSWVAIDDETGQVIGFVNAVSDDVLSAYIPLLEVLPAYKGKGIGTELVKNMMTSLSHLYMIDICCDDDVVPFYKRLDFFQANGMVFRNYDRQSAE